MARDGFQGFNDGGSRFIKVIKVIAKKIDDDGLAFAGDRFRDAVAQKSGGGLMSQSGEGIKRVAYGLLSFFLLRSGDIIFQIDMKFAHFRAEGIFTKLGAAKLN